MPPKRPFLLGFFFFGAFLLCLLGLWWSEIALLSNEKQLSLSTQPSSSRLFLRTILRASWLLFLLGGALLLRFPKRFFSWGLLAMAWGALWVWAAFLDLMDVQKLQHLLQEAPLFQRIHLLSQEWGHTQLHAQREWLCLGWQAIWLAWLAWVILWRTHVLAISQMMWASLTISALFALPIGQSIHHSTGLFSSTAASMFGVSCACLALLLLFALSLRESPPTKGTSSKEEKTPSPTGLFVLALLFSITAAFRMMERILQSTWLAETTTHFADFSLQHQQALYQMITMLDRLLAWGNGTKAGLILLFALFLLTRWKELFSSLQQTPHTILLLLGCAGLLFVLDLFLQKTSEMPMYSATRPHKNILSIYQHTHLPQTKAQTQDWLVPATILLPKKQKKATLPLFQTALKIEVSRSSQPTPPTYYALHQDLALWDLCQSISSLSHKQRTQSKQNPPRKMTLLLERHARQTRKDAQALRLNASILRALALAANAPFPALFPLTLHTTHGKHKLAKAVWYDIVPSKHPQTLGELFARLPHTTDAVHLQCPFALFKSSKPKRSTSPH